MIIKNALIHDAIHEEPFYGDIVIKDGKIVSVGGAAGDEDEVIDAAGLHAYPGFVDAHSHIGLDAYGGPTGGTFDINEMNDIVSPHLRGIDSYNAHDTAIPMALAGGVTTVAAGPGSANVFGGTFLAVKLYGNTVDEAAVEPSVAMKCAFGENPKRCYKDKCDSARMTTAAIFRQTLFEARDYMLRKEAAGDDITKQPKFDMKSEALIPVLKREIPLKAHAHRADDIMTALRIAKEFGLRITIEHCTEGHLIVDELKEADVPVAVGDTIEMRLNENGQSALEDNGYTCSSENKSKQYTLSLTDFDDGAYVSNSEEIDSTVLKDLQNTCTQHAKAYAARGGYNNTPQFVGIAIAQVKSGIDINEYSPFIAAVYEIQPNDESENKRYIVVFGPPVIEQVENHGTAEVAENPGKTIQTFDRDENAFSENTYWSVDETRMKFMALIDRYTFSMSDPLKEKLNWTEN